MLGTNDVSVVILIHDAPKRASFNMLGLKVWVHDPTTLWTGAWVAAVGQDRQRVGHRVILILLRVAGAETVFLGDIPVDLGIALVGIVGRVGLVDRVIGDVAVDRRGIKFGRKESRCHRVFLGYRNLVVDVGYASDRILELRRKL